jgi:hypothetical protein
MPFEKQPSQAQAVEAANQLRVVIGSLKAERVRVLVEREALEHRNAQLLALPISREDLKTVLLDVVDKGAERFLHYSGWDRSFSAFAYPHCQAQPAEKATPWKQSGSSMNMETYEKMLAGDASQAASLIGETPFWNMALLGGDVALTRPMSLCFMHGDLLKLLIEKHFDALCPALNPAPAKEPATLAERRAEIAKNDARLSELSTQFSKIEVQLEELTVRT